VEFRHRIFIIIQELIKVNIKIKINIKMYTLRSTVLGLAVAAVLFTSCDKKENKKDDDHHHAAEATITITAPAEGQEFNHQNTVNVTGKIESTEALHGYKIVIRQKSDNSVKFEKDDHSHGTTINFDESWINNVAGMQDMEVEVTAIIDHDGNTTTKKVNFHCHGH
jgi:hypothetical protein